MSAQEVAQSVPDLIPCGEQESVVYFIGAPNGLVKIGFASNFLARYGQLCGGSPVPLHPLASVSGDRQTEREYHERFKASRRHGEWFELTEDLEEEIDRLGLASNPHYYVPHRYRGIALPLTLTRANFEDTE